MGIVAERQMILLVGHKGDCYFDKLDPLYRLWYKKLAKSNLCLQRLTGTDSTKDGT